MFPSPVPPLWRLLGRPPRLLKMNDSRRAPRRPRLTSLAVIPTMMLLLLTLPGCKEQKKIVKPPERPVSVQVEAFVYRLPRAIAAAEVLGQPKNTDYAAVLKRVQALVAEKKAILFATTSVLNHSGQRTVAESIIEQRYPTEFEPPQIPQTVGTVTPTRTTRSVTTTVTTTEEETTSFPHSFTTPTAFETRNCGMTIECEPVYDKEVDTLSFNAVIQFVELLRFVKYPADNGATVDQPIFHTRKLTQSWTMKNGGIAFLGTVDPEKSLTREEDVTDVTFFHAATQ